MTGVLAPCFLPDQTIIPGRGLHIGFGGDDVFPVFVLLNDGIGGHALYRWMGPDEPLEMLSQGVLILPVPLTVIAASGRSECMKLQIRRAHPQNCRSGQSWPRQPTPSASTSGRNQSISSPRRRLVEAPRGYFLRVWTDLPPRPVPVVVTRE